MDIKANKKPAKGVKRPKTEDSVRKNRETAFLLYSVDSFSFNVTEEHISIDFRGSTQIFNHPTGTQRFTEKFNNKKKTRTVSLENLVLQGANLIVTLKLEFNDDDSRVHDLFHLIRANAAYEPH